MSSITISPLTGSPNITLYNMDRKAQHLDGWDISVVVIYFLLVLATGFYVSNYQSLYWTQE